MALGERIKARRLALRWTQDTLAQKAGISKGFLSDVENGKRSLGAETLLDIAQVLRLSLDFLMKGTDEESPQKEVEIPASLAEFASEASLTFRKTLTLLDMQRQIIAHRSAGDKQAHDKIDWARFYESVKDFL
ncbi:MAG: helix-turn-helix transcriptional regulator [Phycisphaerae bacterium]|nr:helix-turn-helix transcriptional regulator [Phycisphaerae bacterium]